VGGDQLAQPVLRRRLGGRRDRNVLEGHAVPLRGGPGVLVVGHHDRHVDGQLTDVTAVEQVAEAVVGSGHHQQGAPPAPLVAHGDHRFER
jgi:hypothetical protein